MMNQKIYNIVIADNQEIIRYSLRNIIDSEDNMQIIDCVRNGEELLKSVDIQMPDVCIIDLDMPIMNGLVASRKLLKIYPDIKIVVFTMYKLTSLMKRIFNMGVKAYLIKTCDKAELISAINHVAKGKIYFSDEIFV